MVLVPPLLANQIYTFTGRPVDARLTAVDFAFARSSGKLRCAVSTSSSSSLLAKEWRTIELNTSNDPNEDSMTPRRCCRCDSSKHFASETSKDRKRPNVTLRSSSRSFAARPASASPI